ncbi:MAG: ROK family protein [Chloroflexota bacterium]|nr:ROK family protein [Chloroflexota bacterium]
MAAGQFVGIDLGGTLIRAALGDAQGHIVRRADADTHPEAGIEAVADSIAALVDEAIREVGREAVHSVALGVPGPVDPRTGILYDPPNLVKGEVPIKSMLEERIGLTVHVANDANVAAIGEWLFGGHGKTDHLVYITISTGVGAGIISHGRLIDGFNATAGEIGHTVIDPNGPPCTCGNHGCVESFCSGTNIGRFAREALERGEQSLMRQLAGGDISSVSSKHVVEAAQRGDPVAGRIFFEAADRMGIAVVNVIHVLSPEFVVLGGGVSQAGELLFGPIRDRVRRTALRLPARNVKIVPAGLGVDSGLVGAIGLAALEAAQTA